MIALIAMSLAVEPGRRCTSVPPLLEGASRALIDVETEEAQRRLAAAEQALIACRERFEPEVLARLWLLEGVLRTVEGDSDAASDAFGAAQRAAPKLWYDDFGPAMRASYEAAASVEVPSGRVELVPELGTNRAWLDGTEVSGALLEMPSGLHALQLTDVDGAVLFGQILWVPPNERMRLDTGIMAGTALARPQPEPVVTVPEPPPPEPREPRVRKPLDPLLVAGAGAAVVGGALFAWSFERSAAMDGETSADALRARYREHAATRISGLGLFGLGAAAVGVSFTF